MANQIRKKSLWLVIIVLLSAALACNLPTGEADTGSNSQSTEEQTQATQPPNDIQNDEVQTPTNEPTAIPDSVVVEPGLSRTNPYPIDVEVVTPYWDFKVLEFHRGEDAWQIIQADNPNNPPPPGKEYVLIKMWLRNKNPTPNAQNFGQDELFVTGDSLRGHGDVLIDRPSPEVVYSDIFTAELFEGWIDVLVDPSDGNLMLVFDRDDSVNGETQPREVRYVALNEGASIEVPSELEGISPNDLGLEPESPAKIGETVIGEDWEVTILEALTGESAMDIVLQMNQKSDPPEDGMEYIALRARMRRISTQDMKDNRPSFWTYRVIKESDSWETIAEPRIRNKNPELFPIMQFYFFPALESEGWFVLTGPAGQTPQLATIDVGGDFSTSRRYFQLTP